MRTLCGGLTSFLIFMAALAYAASNALELVSPLSPVINYDNTSKHFGNSEAGALKLSDTNFKLAFTLKDYLSGELKNDPRYVSWQPARYSQNDGIFSFDPLGFHECTEEDYAQFNPVAAD